MFCGRRFDFQTARRVHELKQISAQLTALTTEKSRAYEDDAARKAAQQRFGACGMLKMELQYASIEVSIAELREMRGLDSHFNRIVGVVPMTNSQRKVDDVRKQLAFVQEVLAAKEAKEKEEAELKAQQELLAAELESKCIVDETEEVSHLVSQDNEVGDDDGEMPVLAQI